MFRAVVRPSVALLVFTLGFTASASAQTLTLRDLLPDFVRNGIRLAPPAEGLDHSAHFTSDSSPQFQALVTLNDAIGRQVSNLPLNSSAGGFAYELDDELGVFIRPTQSFGSVYTERPLTLGKGRYNVGLSVTEFNFDSIDELSLREGELGLVFNHSDTNDDGSTLDPAWEGDLVTTELSLSIKSRITSLVAEFGITDRFDLGLAAPFVDLSMQMSAVSTVARVSSGNRDIHVFPTGQDTDVDNRSGSASGIGDVLLRGKYQVLRSGRNYVGGVASLRLPTGDEANLLGTGETQAGLWLIASHIADRVNPTANVGYFVSSGDLPAELRYTAGLSWAVDPKMTVAADILGRTQFGVEKVVITENTYEFIALEDEGLPGDHVQSVELPRLTVTEKQDVSALHGSIGLKINFASTWLLTVNGLFPIQKAGLSDKFTALLGVDYSF